MCIRLNWLLSVFQSHHNSRSQPIIVPVGWGHCWGISGTTLRICMAWHSWDIWNIQYHQLLSRTVSRQVELLSVVWRWVLANKVTLHNKPDWLINQYKIIIIILITTVSDYLMTGNIFVMNSGRRLNENQEASSLRLFVSWRHGTQPIFVTRTLTT